MLSLPVRRTEFSSDTPMTTKTNAVKKYRHCYEASEEGSCLVEVTEKSFKLFWEKRFAGESSL